MQVTVYTTPGCVGCQATKRHLRKARVEFVEVDLTEDQVALDRVKLLGYSSAPVVIVEGLPDGGTDHWGDYRPDQCDALAELAA